MTAILTNSGVLFDLVEPSHELVSINDIASSLSKICRFGGQVNRFYSVAEHSVHCCEVAIEDGHTRQACLSVLLHDAAEAYIGDMVRPLKSIMPRFNEIEARLISEIGQAFYVDFERWNGIIASIDDALLLAERRQLFDRLDAGQPLISVSVSNRVGVGVGVSALDLASVRSVSIQCQCWSPDESRRKFLDLFHRLW